MSPTSSTVGDRTIASIAISTSKQTRRAPRRRQPAPAPAPRADLLASFGPFVIVVRWATIALGLALAALDDTEPQRLLGYGAFLVAYAAWRTVRPLRYVTERIQSLVEVLFEVGLTLAVVVSTGYWRSPYVFALATAVLAAGLARGFGFALRTAATAVVAIAIPYHLEAPEADLVESVQWGTELVLVGIIAGYARRLFGEAEEQTVLARQANELLAQLYDIAQTLPSSLDLDAAAASTLADFRHVLSASAVAVLVEDEAGTGWVAAAAEGVRLPQVVDLDSLPVAATSAMTEQRAVHTTSGPFLAPGAADAIYVPLVARGRLIGVVAAERTSPRPPDEAELAEAASIAHRAALAVDNARWFTRLRRVGADEERTRIARDLHDRVGQSLAFVGFELDRITKAAAGLPVEDELAGLRTEVRRVVGEVRDTLYDLRTDVTESTGLVATLGDYLERVAERTGLRIEFDHDETVRLPLRQEREMWRIAQEAVANVVKHAQATVVVVRWRRDERAAVLEVEDDGVGPGSHGTPRQDAYGVRGMRERAAAIGGRLTMTRADSAGTLVRCEVGP